MIKTALKILSAVVILSTLSYGTFEAVKNLQENAFESKVVAASFDHIKRPARNSALISRPISAENTFIKDVNLYIEGKKINSRNSILCRKNRYYFNVSVFEDNLNYRIKSKDNRFIAYRDDSVDIDNREYIDKDLIHNSITLGNSTYISMIDLTEDLNLTASWNYEKSNLSFYRLKKEEPHENRKHFKRPALIRFEDVAAGTVYANNDNLRKMRIIADYMYKKDVPFHIAWIPRYINPEKGIDNNLLEVYSLANVDFLYTLDYMIARGGIVGLHGYTHQYGGEESIIGSEFGDKWCSNIEETKDRIEAAVNTAKELDIPYDFFESPHYRSTKEQQQMVFENYFSYMFEPSKVLFNTKPALSTSNEKTIYVPAALGYVHDDDVEDMINRIKNKPKEYIAAFFYHPTKEFPSITLKETDGSPDYEYSNNSILHRLLDSLNEQGYTPVKITDIKLSKKSP